MDVISFWKKVINRALQLTEKVTKAILSAYLSIKEWRVVINVCYLHCEGANTF